MLIFFIFWTMLPVFDRSSCRRAYARNALVDVSILLFWDVYCVYYFGFVCSNILSALFFPKFLLSFRYDDLFNSFIILVKLIYSTTDTYTHMNDCCKIVSTNLFQLCCLCMCVCVFFYSYSCCIHFIGNWNDSSALVTLFTIFSTGWYESSSTYWNAFDMKTKWVLQ